jgi:uncharacterized membrane protein YfcA
VGALASGINTVAGGGSLLSFPALTIGFQIPSLPANATNSVALWPGSLAGAFGFRNLWRKCAQHLKALWLPTVLGSMAGAWLLLQTGQKLFQMLVPALILLAAGLLWVQPYTKKLVESRTRKLSVWFGIVLQFFVSLYGGYFGAGMGIMMLACFALYMDGTIHELNAVKNWLGVLINLVASIQFVTMGIVVGDVALALVCGSMVGGFLSARFSQRVDGDKLRKAIAVYGVVTAMYFLFQMRS